MKLISKSSFFNLKDCYAYIFIILNIISCSIILPQRNINSTCNSIEDPRYKTAELLELFAQRIDTLIVAANEPGFDYRVENNQPILFFVYDLTDTTNNTITNDCIEFIDRHVYHFCARNYYHALSNISVLSDGEVRVFEALNCSCKGDSIYDVMQFLMIKGIVHSNEDKIAERVMNYREYSKFHKECNFSFPNCQE